MRFIFLFLFHRGSKKLDKPISFTERKYCSRQIRKQLLSATKTTISDIIAGNGSVLKNYMFVKWLYIFKTLYIDIYFFCFLLMYHIATFNFGYEIVCTTFIQLCGITINMIF